MPQRLHGMPNTLALIRADGVDATVAVEILNEAGLTLKRYSITVGATAKSLPNIVGAALPVGGVRGVLRVVAGGAICANYGGTIEGGVGVGNGIESADSTPTATSPFRVEVGDIAEFGQVPL